MIHLNSTRRCIHAQQEGLKVLSAAAPASITLSFDVDEYIQLLLGEECSCPLTNVFEICRLRGNDVNNAQNVLLRMVVVVVVVVTISMAVTVFMAVAMVVAVRVRIAVVVRMRVVVIMVMVVVVAMLVVVAVAMLVVMTVVMTVATVVSPSVGMRVSVSPLVRSADVLNPEAGGTVANNTADGVEVSKDIL